MERHFNSSQPIELLCKDTFYVGHCIDIANIDLRTVVIINGSYNYGSDLLIFVFVPGMEVEPTRSEIKGLPDNEGLLRTIKAGVFRRYPGLITGSGLFAPV